MSESARWFRLNVTWDDSTWLSEIPWPARAVWPVVLAHMKLHGRAGKCEAPNIRRFASAHDIPEKSVHALIEAAVKDGALVIEGRQWHLTNWEVYQGAESIERVRKLRDAAKSTAVEPTVTLHAVTDRYMPLHCHATETMTETETLTIGEIPPNPQVLSDHEASVHEVISYFNLVAGRNYKPNGEACKALRTRLKESNAGATVLEAKLIVDYKMSEWAGDPKSKVWIRPETLFRKSHWETYSQEAQEWHSGGRRKSNGNSKSKLYGKELYDYLGSGPTNVYDPFADTD